MKQKFLRFVSKAAMFAASFGLVFSSLAPMAAHAADIITLSDQMTRIQTLVTADHTFTFTTASSWTSAAANDIIIRFPASSFTAGGATTTWVVGDLQYDGSVTSVANVAAINAVVGTTLVTGDFPSCTSVNDVVGAIAQSVNDSTGVVREVGFRKCGTTGGGQADTAGVQKLYIFGTSTTGAGTLTNPASGSVLVTIEHGAGVAATDTGQLAVDIIADDTISTTATVDPTIDFEVGMNATQATLCTTTSDISVTTSLALGVIAPGSINYDGYICTRLDTNATNGATVYMQSVATSGVGGGQLTSVLTTADDIPDTAKTTTGEDALAAGTEDYKACVSEESLGTGAGGSTLTIDVDFDSTGETCGLSATTIGADISTSQEAIWSVNSPASNAFGNLVILTAVSATTEAHSDYTDYLVFTAAATF